MFMTMNEAVARYNFITKILLHNENKDELSKDLKVKIMSMRIELSKIKKVFDEDSKAFGEELITDDFRNLAQKENKSEEEIKDLQEQEAKINELYASYITQLNQKEVDFNTFFTEDEYSEIVKVNIDNDVEINNIKISSSDFLEIIYSLFVK